MDKKKPDLHTEQPQDKQTYDAPERRVKSRRRMLQSLAAGGAAVTVKTLPERWTKPVLNDVLLPAHAQPSPPPPPECAIECEIAEVNSNENLPGIGISGGLPVSGGETITLDSFEDATFFSFRQITVEVGEDCPAGNVDLEVDMNTMTDQLTLVNGNQNAAVVGGVATFNEVTVNISPPIGGGTATGNLEFRFAKAGTDDCVINVNFEEMIPVPGP